MRKHEKIKGSMSTITLDTVGVGKLNEAES